MSATHLYHIVMKAMRQLRPHERITRLRASVWMIVGLYLGQDVQLRQIARKIPGWAATNSKIRRLRRLLKNPAVHVRKWYAPQARALLAAAAEARGEVRLLVDGTKVSASHQLLMVAVAYRRRALPIAWTWVRSARGHSSGAKQCALLSYVRGLLPAKVRVILVGDSEFGSVAVLKQLEKWHWGYVLRQKGDTRVQLPDQPVWWRFDSLVTKGAGPRWLPGTRLTRQHGHRVHLIAWWKSGEKDPWLLATNLPTLQSALRAYKRRMWIEEMFGDMKGHGFDLETTRLRHFQRLSRLTLFVAILYVWLVTRGSQVTKWGQRRLVDRTDRRDLSVFHIGLCMFDRYISNRRLFQIRWIPYFS